MQFISGDASDPFKPGNVYRVKGGQFTKSVTYSSPWIPSTEDVYFSDFSALIVIGSANVLAPGVSDIRVVEFSALVPNFKSKAINDNYTGDNAYRIDATPLYAGRNIGTVNPTTGTFSATLRASLMNNQFSPTAGRTPANVRINADGTFNPSTGAATINIESFAWEN